MSKKVVVIGGGAAGMMAAGTAAKHGANITLIEKNKILGKKLLITGKGRCNLTNACDDVETLIQNVPSNGTFLYSAFYSFTNFDTMSFFENLGIKLKTERGNRVFPESDKSADIVVSLRKYCTKENVEFKTGEAVEILQNNNNVTGVRLANGQIIGAESVIVATGGMSYKATGSTGDGYKLAKAAGHTVIPPAPSLVPVETVDDWPTRMQGLALKNISISVVNSAGKIKYTDFGEMLFTHFGVSGPVILSASAHMRDIESEKYKIIIDLKPALTIEQLDKRVQKDFLKYINKDFKNSLSELLPQRMIDVLIELSEIPPSTKVNSITKEQRALLVHLLKNLTLTVKNFRPIDEAIITSGGVTVREIDPSTMQSKLLKGMYFAGEVIDVDAYTGGFNLQIAFSTGYLAGLNCAK